MDQAYPDETWHMDYDGCGAVRLGTFTYDDTAKEFDDAPVRIMVQDESGEAEAYLTISVAEGVHEELGKAIQRAKDARHLRVVRP